MFLRKIGCPIPNSDYDRVKMLSQTISPVNSTSGPEKRKENYGQCVTYNLKTTFVAMFVMVDW